MGEIRVKIACPVCGKEGTLQEKTTVTKSGSKRYVYKKLYCRHTVGSRRLWHYLTPQMLKSIDSQREYTGTQERQLGGQKRKETDSSQSQEKRTEMEWARSSAWIEHRPSKPMAAGSNPAGPATNPIEPMAEETVTGQNLDRGRQAERVEHRE